MLETINSLLNTLTNIPYTWVWVGVTGGIALSMVVVIMVITTKEEKPQHRNTPNE